MREQVEIHSEAQNWHAFISDSYFWPKQVTWSSLVKGLRVNLPLEGGTAKPPDKGGKYREKVKNLKPIILFMRKTKINTNE